MCVCVSVYVGTASGKLKGNILRSQNTDTPLVNCMDDTRSVWWSRHLHHYSFCLCEGTGVSEQRDFEFNDWVLAPLLSRVQHFYHTTSLSVLFTIHSVDRVTDYESFTGHLQLVKGEGNTWVVNIPVEFRKRIKIDCDRIKSSQFKKLVSSG